MDQRMVIPGTATRPGRGEVAGAVPGTAPAVAALPGDDQ